MGHDYGVSTGLWEEVLWDQNSWGLRCSNSREHEGEAAWSHLQLGRLDILPSLLGAKNRKGSRGAKHPPKPGAPPFPVVSEVPAALQKKQDKGARSTSAASCQDRKETHASDRQTDRPQATARISGSLFLDNHTLLDSSSWGQKACQCRHD